MKTQSERIREFTSESLGTPLPTKPEAMTKEQVEFLVKMNCEELMELMATVYKPEDDLCMKLVGLANQAKSPANRVFETSLDLIAEQVDALVDIGYFNGNAAAKVGWNLDDAFDMVHEANMLKRFPDGTFHKIDGKIVKPPGWKAPCVSQVVASWFQKETTTNEKQ